MTGRTYLWRRLDLDGHTFVRVEERSDGIRTEGVEVCAEAGSRWMASFAVELDAGWRHRSTEVEVIDAEGPRHRRLDDLGGCDVVDLAGNPFTNGFVLRRHDRDVEVLAAYVETPSLDVRPLRQRYRRLEERRWEYVDETGSFWLTVDEDGVTVDYQDLAERV